MDETQTISKEISFEKDQSRMSGLVVDNEESLREWITFLSLTAEENWKESKDM